MGISVTKIAELNKLIKGLQEIKANPIKGNEYPNWVLDIFELEPKEEDYQQVLDNIHSHKEKFMKNDKYVVSKFTKKQVVSYLTRIEVGERQYTGFVISYLNSGLLLELLKRLKAIYVNTNKLEANKTKKAKSVKKK